MNRRPVIHTLRKAMCVVGSWEELAMYLGVERAELSAWLRGEAFPPPRPYLDAIDLVENGRRQARGEPLRQATGLS